MSGFRLRPKALTDIVAIGDYIAADNPVRAVSIIDEILTLCSRVAEEPRVYQRRADLASGLRQAMHGRYLILFTMEDGGVTVERVVHGARRLDDLI